jgi:hypothetical protein
MCLEAELPGNMHSLYSVNLFCPCGVRHPTPTSAVFSLRHLIELHPSKAWKPFQSFGIKWIIVGV